MRVGLGKLLDRNGSAAVGIAFAQDGVHRRSLDRVIPRADRLFVGVGGRFGIVGQGKALPLKLFDRCHQLRHGGRDIGQLDHIGFRSFYQFAQFRQIVRLALVLRQVVREGGDDAPGERDVARADADACGGCKGLDDGQERGRGQLRCFVDLGIDDIRHGQRIFHGKVAPCLHRQGISSNGIPLHTVTRIVAGEWVT